MAARSDQPIIIKRIKKVAHAHHGGAWKVAYADFVTAMMAFFLLLWLLNVTTDVERKGIADYFAPASISKSDSGAGGVFGGQTITAPGAQISDSSPPGMSKAIPEPDQSDQDREEAPGAGAPQGPKTNEKGDVTTGPNADVPAAIARLEREEKVAPVPEKKEQAAQGKNEEEKLAEEKKKEEESFKKAEQALREAIKGVPELAALEKNFIIDSTPEGLRIQIVDKDGYSLFAPGSATLAGKSRQLVHFVGLVMARMPNKITITGHTDNTPFPRGARRNNWILSTDRAESSLEVMLEAGEPQEKVMGVIGKSDRDPLIKDDPANSQNRRLSIVLLRRFLDKADLEKAAKAVATPASTAPAAIPATAPATPATAPAPETAPATAPTPPANAPPSAPGFAPVGTSAPPAPAPEPVPLPPEPLPEQSVPVTR